jgi:hypothetical protein
MVSPADTLSPLALDEALRACGSAASELDAVLADLEAWVRGTTDRLLGGGRGKEEQR